MIISKSFWAERFKSSAPAGGILLGMRTVRLRLMLLALAGTLLLSGEARALTILSGPSFTQATNAPLSGILQITTDVPSRVSVSVDDGVSPWSRSFYDFSTSHVLPLFGFKPGRTNVIAVTLNDQNRNAITAAQPPTFITGPLPSTFPNITLVQSDPAQMEPGYTLFRVGVHGNTFPYVVIVDDTGQVVWYDTTPSTADVRQLPNGHLFMPGSLSFFEMDLLGNTNNTWTVPAGLPIDAHDGVPTDHGTILYLADETEVVTNYPLSMTIPNPPVGDARVYYQEAVEISATNSDVLNIWRPIDVLDPRRVSYLIGLITQGWDSEHSNAILEDPSDDSLIVSMRHQNAVVKISRSTGQIHWILGPHDDWGPEWQPYLLTPVGEPFVWNYGQHAPVLTPQGTLMLYDDGNFRAMPYASSIADSNNYSRAVEYKINEQTMEVSQVWDYGRTNAEERLYTGYEGSADPLPQTGNVLIGFPAISYVNGVPPSAYGPSATMARIKEVTHDAVPQTVFDLTITMYDKPGSAYQDCTIYRCHRIPDLYAHPASPVGDLTVNYQNQTPLLQFSADDAHTYAIQGSTNLVDWVDLGSPYEEEANPGYFDFQDSYSNAMPVRFYRVVTQ
jgi:arylsulfate sulfotransferase